MMSIKSKRKFSRVVLAMTIGMAVVIGCAASGARAADDDDEDVAPDTKILRNIMKHLGLRRDQPNIEYRERSPLVLPPGPKLPSPEANAKPVSKTAAWPDDPDIKQAKKKKQAEIDRKPYTEGVDDRPLLPNQLGGGASPNPRVGNEGSRPGADETSRPSSPAELGSKSIFTWWRPNEDVATFSGEPPRSSLIEPPRGYRTPSPNQAFGVNQREWKPSAVNEADRHNEVK